MYGRTPRVQVEIQSFHQIVTSHKWALGKGHVVDYLINKGCCNKNLVMIKTYNCFSKHTWQFRSTKRLEIV